MSLVETRLIDRLPSSIEGAVDDRLTLPYDWGWIFFWNSRQFIETGAHELWGNNPYLVNKLTGDVTQIPPKTDIEDFVRVYEKEL